MRFSPFGDTALIARGEIVRSVTNECDLGCNNGIYVRVNDIKDFFRKQLRVGHHFVWTYGDHIEDLKELAEMFNVEVLEA